MFGRRLVGAILVAFVLLGAGTILGARLTQGQEPDPPQTTIVATGNGFTYQGQLTSADAPVNATCDFTFGLYAAPTGGNPIGSPETETNVTLEDGRFTVTLNDANQFGPDAFNGDPRWLDITVQCSGDAMPTGLGRQPLTATPYALSAASAPWDGLTGIPADIADGDDDTTYSAGAGLALNNGEFSATGHSYDNVIVVAKSGGDFTEIQAALDSINDASETNRYLVWVAPGTYEEQVTMKEYVDVEGAGENLTTIRWFGGTLAPDEGGDSASVRGAAHSRLRDLTVESVPSGSQFALAIYSDGLDNTFSLTQVTTLASGGDDSYGIVAFDSMLVMDNITVTASGDLAAFGVLNEDSPSLMTNVTASASGGSETNNAIFNAFSSPRMTNVTAEAEGDGAGSNFGIYNHVASPVMTNVTASASGNNSQNLGVLNFESTPEMTAVSSSALGDSSENYGVRNDNAAPLMVNVTVTVAGIATVNHGVSNHDSSPLINTITIFVTGDGSGSDVGVYNEDSHARIRNAVISSTGAGVVDNSSSSRIHHSQIYSGENSISHTGSGEMHVAHSELNEPLPPASTSNVTCLHSYDENLNFLDENCQPIP